MTKTIRVQLHIKATDHDGYGILELEAPASAIRWEGEPKERVDVEHDVYEIDIESLDGSGYVVSHRHEDLDKRV